MPAPKGGSLTLKIAGDVSQLQEALKQVAPAVGITIKETQAKTEAANHEHVTKLAAGQEKVAGAVEGVTSRLEKTAAVGAVAMGGIAALAMKEEQSMTGLSAALDATGQKTDDWKKQVEEAADKNHKLGISTDQTVGSLQTLVQAGVSYKDAVEAQGQIADIAAAKHVDLATATDMVAKASLGKAGALKTLGVVTTTQAAADALAAKNQKQAAADLAAVEAAQTKYNDAVKAHGAHSAQAQSAEQALGKAQKKRSDDAKAAADSQTAIDGKAIGVMAVLEQTQKRVHGQAQAQADTTAGKMKVWGVQIESVVTSTATKLLPIITVAGPAIAGLTVIIEAVGPAIGAVNAAMTFLAANPIVLVIAAIVAVVAILVILELKFGFVQKAAGAVFDWIKAHWPLLLDILLGPFGFVLGLIIQHFGQIKDAVGTLVGDIASAIKPVADVLLAPFKIGWNAIAGLWNNSLGKLDFKVPGWVPVIGGNEIKFPQLPTFHTGGIVPGAPGTDVLAMLRAGERVTPANNVSGGSGGHTFVTNVTTNATAEQIVRQQSWQFRRGGY